MNTPILGNIHYRSEIQKIPDINYIFLNLYYITFRECLLLNLIVIYLIQLTICCSLSIFIFYYKNV